MKKLFLLSAILFAGLSVFAEEEVFSKVYATRFFHCFPTQRTYQNNDVMTYNTVGWWKDGRCRYTFGTKNEEGKPEKYNCNFTREQVTSFESAMKQDPNCTGPAKTMLEQFKKDENTCQKDN